ncbi:MAG: DMT family transporter [Rhizobiales bacterium]|nr:DMT family transporter [Hyphomicrobiales bacterium]
MSVAAPAIPQAENRTRGILWMLATMFCFISLDALMKLLLETYPLVQVTWARFFFATVIAIMVAAPRLPEIAVSRAPRFQLLRSVLLMVTTGLFNAGIRTTPLATATTIMFMSPILVTVLSTLILREHVGPRRWASIAVGFLGAMIVVRPWESLEGTIGFGVLFLLIAAFSNANYQIATRHVRLDDPMTSLLYTAVAGAVVTSLMLPWSWKWPTGFDWLLLASTGLAGGLGHLCLIRALQAAPASVVAPFSYSSLVWATLFGFVIFGDLPDMWTWAGAVLIIASGLYIFHRERQLAARRRPPTQEETP